MGQARTEMSLIIKPRHPLEEYFELERTSEEKYEYFNGEVVCMSREDPQHSLIEVNVLRRSVTGCEKVTVVFIHRGFASKRHGWFDSNRKQMISSASIKSFDF